MEFFKKPFIIIIPHLLEKEYINENSLVFLLQAGQFLPLVSLAQKHRGNEFFQIL